MWASLRLSGLLALCAGPLPAQVTQPPLITDRPDFTESASSVAPGHLQLEAGYTFTNVDAVNEHAIGEALIRIGIAKRLEGRIGASVTWVDRPGDDDSGLDDPSLGIKIVLAEGGSRLAVALLASTTVPAGSDEVTEDEWQPGATGALAWDLSGRLGLGANLGYTYASEGGERFDQGSASVALSAGLAERTGAYLEVFTIFPAGEDADDDVTLNGGITYLVSDDFQLDARIGAGLTDDAPDIFVGFGVARRW
ncbi:MAG: transporter [Gemmatimonadota bacterium]|jgi:hypothetical protein